MKSKQKRNQDVRNYDRQNNFFYYYWIMYYITLLMWEGLEANLK